MEVNKIIYFCLNNTIILGVIYEEKTENIISIGNSIYFANNSVEYSGGGIFKYLIFIIKLCILIRLTLLLALIVFLKIIQQNWQEVA